MNSKVYVGPGAVANVALTFGKLAGLYTVQDNLGGIQFLCHIHIRGCRTLSLRTSHRQPAEDEYGRGP